MTLVESQDKCIRGAAPVLKTGRKWSANKSVVEAKATSQSRPGVPNPAPGDRLSCTVHLKP